MAYVKAALGMPFVNKSPLPLSLHARNDTFILRPENTDSKMLRAVLPKESAGPEAHLCCVLRFAPEEPLVAHAPAWPKGSRFWAAVAGRGICCYATVWRKKQS